MVNGLYKLQDNHMTLDGYDLFSPLLDKDIFLENVYIALWCPIKKCYF